MKKISLKKNVVCSNMEAMRSEFVTLCEQNAVSIDRTCIKQSKSYLNKGVVVGMSGKDAVTSLYWNREVNEEDGKRYYNLLCTRSINKNAGNPLYDFSEYATEEPTEPETKPAKKQKKGKAKPANVQEEAEQADSFQPSTDEPQEGGAE